MLFDHILTAKKNAASSLALSFYSRRQGNSLGVVRAASSAVTPLAR